MKGLSLKQAAKITPQDIIAALDGLPEDSQNCAELAVKTLRAVIASHQKIVNPSRIQITKETQA